MKYHQNTLDLFYSVEHSGKLSDGAGVHHYSHSVPDIFIAVDVNVVADHVEQALFQTTGNTVVIAVCEYLCRLLVGQDFSAIQLPSLEQIIETLNIDRIHQHNVLLILQTLKPMQRN